MRSPGYETLLYGLALTSPQGELYTHQESERTLSLTTAAVAKASAFSCTCSPRPSSFIVSQRRPGDTRIALQEMNPRFKDPNSLIMNGKQTYLCFEGTHYLPRLFAIQASLGKWSRTREIVLLLIDVEKLQRPLENCFPKAGRGEVSRRRNID